MFEIDQFMCKLFYLVGLFFLIVFSQDIILLSVQ